MKTGEVYINDLDIYVNYSACLIDDSFTNLLLPGNMKEYAENDLRSQPGKQVFVTNPQPTDRDVQVTFLLKCKSRDEYLSKFAALTSALNDGVVLLKVVPLKLTFKLLTTSYISLSAYLSGSAGSLVVKFNEPNPKDRIAL